MTVADRDDRAARQNSVVTRSASAVLMLPGRAIVDMET